MRLDGKKKKQDPSICCLQETHFSFSLKGKEQRYIIQTAIMESKSGHTNSRQKDFKTKAVTRDKEEYFIMISQSVKKMKQI